VAGVKWVKWLSFAFVMWSSKPKFTPGVPYEVQRVYDMLTPKPKELLNNAANRRLISEGEVGVFNHKERRTKRRYLFLFSDVLLITKKEGKSSYWLKIFVALGPNLRVEDVPDTATRYKVEFRIYALKRTIILFTQSEEEKLKWLKQINEALGKARGDDEYAHQYTAPEPIDYSAGSAAPVAAAPAATAASSDPFDFFDSRQTPQPTPTATTSKAQPEKESLQITGDIGKIEIPGFGGGSFSGYDSDPDDDDNSVEFAGFAQAPNTQVQNIIQTSNAPPPATPPSTPVQGSAFDDFDSLINRRAGGAPAQTPAPAPTVPSTSVPFDPFAQSEPLQPTPSSFPMGDLLQPVPVNSSPAFGSSGINPTPSSQVTTGNFDALKSLSMEGQNQNQGMGYGGYGYGGGMPQQQPSYDMYSQNAYNPNLSVDEQMKRLSMNSPFFQGNQ